MVRLPHSGHLHLAAHNAAPGLVRSWIQQGPLPDRAQVPKSVWFYVGTKACAGNPRYCWLASWDMRKFEAPSNARNRLTAWVPLGGSLYLNCSTKLVLLPAMNGEVSALRK